MSYISPETKIKQISATFTNRLASALFIIDIKLLFLFEELDFQNPIERNWSQPNNYINK